MSDDLLKTIVASTATIVTGLVAVGGSILLARVGQIHKLVNSAAAAMQAKIDADAIIIAELRKTNMLLEIDRNGVAKKSRTKKTL